MSRVDAMNYAERHMDRFISDLMSLLTIESISADPNHVGDIKKGAEFIQQQLSKAGLQSSIVEGSGHPLVRGNWNGAKGAPTVIAYGHYDVQPADPCDLWETPPFKPTVKEGMIRARGCADDKGPVMALISGLESWIRGHGSLPMNIIVLIEGEEECGGNVLPDYIRQNSTELASDILIVLDCPGYGVGIPSIVYGLRGICTLEVRVDGPLRDLHSGSYGGVLCNPAEALCHLIASCRGEDGTFMIEGILQDVLPLTSEERRRISDLRFDEQGLLSEVGSSATFGEPGFTMLERRWTRPTFEVNGLFGGYQGKGMKTIIPACAGAKISMRLVPNQDPQKVLSLARQHFEQRVPAGIQLTIEEGAGAPAVIVDVDSPAIRGAYKALTEGFHHEPVLCREGGSIPVISTFVEHLAVTPILIGTYRPGEKAHSPNEQYHIDDFRASVGAVVHLMECLADEL